MNWLSTSNNTPFEELLDKYKMQLNQMNIIPNQEQYKVVNDINDALKGLNNEELTILYGDNEFKEIKNYYDIYFMEFLVNKFSYEFTNTEKGSKIGSNLLNVIKNKTNIIRENLNEERSKINELARILKDNPNIINQLKNKVSET